MGVAGGPDIVQNRLVLDLDASDRNSYVSGSTTWFDVSGNNNNAALTAATASLPSIEFTRTNNTRATISPTLNLSSTNVITVDFWVNFKTLPTVSGYTGDYVRIICELSDNFNSFLDTFAIDVEYELTGFRWLVATHGNGGTFSGYNIKNIITPLPAINTWYNFTVVINNSIASANPYTFYLNGVVQTNIGTTSNNGQTYDAQNTNNFGNRIFRIGGRGATSFSQNMFLSNFKIYTTALSAAEVSQNYNALKSRFGIYT
jgi:hypothetical protein